MGLGVLSSLSSMSSGTADGTAFASEAEYHTIADAHLEEVQDILEALEDEMDDIDINYSMGVLNIDLGSTGFWVLNKQTPNRQIWWSSPISGPRRYEYSTEDKAWVSTREPEAGGKRDLRKEIAREIGEATGVVLDN